MQQPGLAALVIGLLLTLAAGPGLAGPGLAGPGPAGPGLAGSSAADPLLLATASPAAVAIEDHYTAQLLGLYVGGEEKTGIVAYVSGNDYLLPLDDVLASIGAEIRQNGGNLEIITPAGNATLDPASLRRADNRQLISSEALREALKIDTRFDQSAYALRLTIPWWIDDRGTETSDNPFDIDFSPPSASLRTLRADVSYFHSDQRDEVFSEYLSAGNIAGGLWQARAAQTPNGELRPFDYYWLKSNAASQLLLGNARMNLHPLLPVVEQTGVQALFSNRPLAAADALSLSTASGNRQVGGNARTIRGSGEPGDIAELRINGGVVDRVRVRLDGRFEFPDVDVANSGYAEVKVLLLDSNSGVLTETLDYSRRVGSGLLEAGRATLFSAIGEQGNLLDSKIDSLGTSGALQWRYGIADGLTVEFGSQYDGREFSTQAGTYLALGDHWFAGLSLADSPLADSAELTVEGGRERWAMNFSAREFDVDRPGEAARQWVRFGNYRYRFSDRLTLGLAGRDASTTYQDERYLLPTVTWSNGRNASFSAWPNIDGKYRLDARYAASRRDTVRYTYEDTNHFVDYRRRLGNGVEYYGLFRDGDSFEERYESGIILHASERRFDRLQAGLVALGGELGYNLQLDARLLPGVYSRLRISENALINPVLEDDPGLLVQWDLTFDFAVTRGRITAADSGFAANTAALSGPLLVGDQPLASTANISRVVLIVDGVSHTASVQGGHYYVDGLSSGVHRVTLDSRYLPLQFRPARDQVFWVQLDRAAATRVPFTLEVSYAVAGKLLDQNGEALAGRTVKIVAEGGAVVATATTDAFGIYRADGLPPGAYRAESGDDRTAVKAFSISDQFLFGVDIIASGDG